MKKASIVSLLLPIYVPLDHSIINAIRWFLRSLLINFNIEEISVIKASKRFTDLQITGSDAKTAVNFLREIFGGPIKWEDIPFGEELNGRVIRVEDGKVLVDIGLVEPDYMKVAVPLEEIIKKVFSKEIRVDEGIAERIGIHRYLPFRVLIREDGPIDYKKREILGEVGISTQKLLKKWFSERYDRLLVFGATRSGVLKAIEKSGHSRDVVNVERLGFLEHSIVCKWGTSSVGLIPEIGEYLRNAKFIAIKPRYFKKLLKVK